MLHRHFISELLDAARVDDHLFFDRICSIWREQLKASWVGLWLYNDVTPSRSSASVNTGGFQLTGQSPWDDKSPVKLPITPEPTSTSLCSYLVDIDKPSDPAIEVLPNIREWTKIVGDKTHSFYFSDIFHEAGLKSCIGVSCCSHERDQEELHRRIDTEESHLRGAFTVHFQEDVPINCDEENLHSLREMSRLSAVAMVRRNLSRKVNIAQSLSNLTQSHLTRFDDKPIVVRRQYARDVCKLLVERLQIPGISIFWRDPFDPETLECITTTGVIETKTRKVYSGGKSTADVRYDTIADAGTMTIEAYTQGYAFACPPRKNSIGKFAEQIGSDQNSSTYFISPVPSQRNYIQDTDPVAPLGVIRCKRNLNSERLESGHLGYFFALDIKLISFVADQISPVLATFESRIRREASVAIVRHDMLAPLVMMRDSAARIVKNYGNIIEKQDEYHLENLRSLAKRLSPLVELLAVNPSEQFPRFQRVELEPDILAPLKRMMVPYAKLTNGMKIQYDGMVRTSNGYQKLPALNADPSLVFRALYNLLTNAVKYGRRGTTINLLVAKTDADELLISVQNQGQGLDIDDDKIWLPFRQGRYASERSIGVGLGLSVVKSIMRQHQGNAVVISSGDPTEIGIIFPSKRILSRGS